MLYEAIVTIEATSNSNSVLASVQRRVGFRTIVLNLELISGRQLTQGIAPGANWHFEISGREFYAKGSNL